MNTTTNTPVKTALVTGASRGIGRAIAQRLARDGFFVIINYAGNTATAEETLADITSAGGHAAIIRADIGDETEVDRLFTEALALNGRLDVVVHNAGIMQTAPIRPDSLELFDRTIRTNLRSAFLMLGHAAEHTAEGGRIIAFSTSVIAKSFPGYGAYIASKAGVEGLVRVLANELRGRNITVNAVAPGPTGTELFYHGKTEAQIQAIAQQSPLERIGEPEEIAAVVSMLAGADGAWINAQILRANGGFA
ncbi:MAG: SDR family oxidoreductase [Neisseria sp.]|nr:SDR family oxidoreductase [Neisseria sp.]